MTDAQTLDFAIAIAEISGVFVGFGVLIGAVQSRDVIAPEKKALAQGVSLLGIVTLLGALVPATLHAFGLSGHTLWFYSAIGFEAFVCLAFAVALSREEFREFGPLNRKRYPIFAVVFWVPLELSLQISFLLILFGLFPEQSNALYLFTLFVNLGEAAGALTLLVFHNESEIEKTVSS